MVWCIAFSVSIGVKSAATDYAGPLPILPWTANLRLDQDKTNGTFKDQSWVEFGVDAPQSKRVNFKTDFEIHC
jgi:hypothetical protein